jgi:hypothetical protein
VLPPVTPRTCIEFHPLQTRQAFSFHSSFSAPLLPFRFRAPAPVAIRTPNSRRSPSMTVSLVPRFWFPPSPALGFPKTYDGIARCGCWRALIAP